MKFKDQIIFDESLSKLKGEVLKLQDVLQRVSDRIRDAEASLFAIGINVEFTTEIPEKYGGEILKLSWREHGLKFRLCLIRDNQDVFFCRPLIETKVELRVVSVRYLSHFIQSFSSFINGYSNNLIRSIDSNEAL